ncbi:Hypothetical predicted protein [Cloeon dipterum]|uniref:Mitochondrial GTPase 1 n=1 Tax=Cloeon dipterum TaxID=197152 RepID=A0A8S1BS59_9INSE|nr:Hypothetical predicted protein [Cloeon dipterum]
MSGVVSRSTPGFRRSFKVPNADALRWFPGHMDKGLKQIESKLSVVDCVIEVHDARVPLSSRNPNFRHTVLGNKPHLLVLNKKDLTDMRWQKEVDERLKSEHGISDVLYTCCKNDRDKNVDQVVPKAIELISQSPRFNREDSEEMNLMIIGVPNVGKSSLINRIRNKVLKKRNSNPVGAEPGITRSVMNRVKVSASPLVFLYDTPGILSPNIKNAETGLRLALCACIKDHLIGIEVIADYLLYTLNKHGNFKYVEMMGLEGPTDNIGTLLTKGAMKMDKYEKRRSHEGYINRPHLSAAAEIFVRAFRDNKFGPVMLDSDLLTNNN